MKYNYIRTLKEDIINYVEENKDYLKGKTIEELYDDMFIADEVTGNASGSYTFSTWEAEENICHNMDLLAEALEEFGETGINVVDKGAEWCDVTIRCYLLGQALEEVKDKIVNILESEDE